MKQREKFEVIPAEGLSAKNTILLASLRGIRKAGRVYRAAIRRRDEVLIINRRKPGATTCPILTPSQPVTSTGGWPC